MEDSRNTFELARYPWRKAVRIGDDFFCCDLALLWTFVLPYGAILIHGLYHFIPQYDFDMAMTVIKISQQTSALLLVP